LFFFCFAFFSFRLLWPCRAHPGLALKGWIHTHPFSGNFLSSADQHTTFDLITQGVHNALAIVIDGKDYDDDALFAKRIPHVKIWQLSPSGQEKVRACDEAERKRKDEEGDEYTPLSALHLGHPHTLAQQSKTSSIIQKTNSIDIIVEDKRHGSAKIDLFESHQLTIQEVTGASSSESEDSDDEESINLPSNRMQLEEGILP
jgi:proteasome lid subunit RPN8/RPN11